MNKVANYPILYFKLVQKFINIFLSGKKLSHKVGKKVRLKSTVSIRIKFDSIRASVATPVKVFHIFRQLWYGSCSKGIP